MSSFQALRGLLLTASLGFAAACLSSDSGFVGTWGAERRGETRSLVSIWRAEDGYRFAVNRYDETGAHLLRCSRGGACAFFDGEAPYFELEFSVRDDSDDTTLYVECSGGPLPGKRGTPIEWVERVTLDPEGETLRVQRIELNGQPIENGPRYYRKRSSSPFR